jgi:hypothetical protein
MNEANEAQLVVGAFEIWAVHPVLGWMEFGTAYSPRQVDESVEILTQNSVMQVAVFSLN